MQDIHEVDDAGADIRLREAAAFRANRLAVVDLILDSREKYTVREWAIVQLYFKCGLSQEEIACIFQVSRPSIARSLGNIRRKALS